MVHLKTGDSDKAVEALKKASALGMRKAEDYLKRKGLSD
jgi:hypothetical protein